MRDLSRNVSLLCSICGNDQFESLDGEFESAEATPDDARFKCSDCGSTFTKEELISENTEKINIAMNELEQDAVKEIEKEINRMFKKFKL